ncbi:cation diffusion facilitator CzcD-associated flavoprotein CzcO [Kineococcus xinjiangensis]|uniref:Cation diffusion facilitator CzcD-associated flavoprotein CzcO n=1 Tax=Kineococcus xinjiangensis TaxID=512762 RepID=A0A2S6IDA1_9ACTN|nr:NAD(P)/FAD-dependent oxidoreductase [Kineococcus xinjiangensis]PPK92198.1 cation diffusion facilitator CzcD-associated flavoprotein CzcO [Kineococcus xinjiangensis]
MSGGNVSGGNHEHVDVLVVGAGISGIGAACQLVRRRPGTSYAVLEARAALGGTWDLFRYPGIRSDSDMFTLGYSFRPWTGAQAIADGAAIRGYVADTAREFGVEDAIRYRHRVVAADWSSAEARWSVQVERTDADGQVRTLRMTCRFLFCGTGYYRYDRGHVPDLPGLQRFRGTIVHPQHWPADLDVNGKHVVVVGSGATAVTLVPALAGTAAHVTMLQRTPSWVLSLPSRDPLAEKLRDRLPVRLSYPLVRWRNVLRAQLLFQLSRRRPERVRGMLREQVRRQIPPTQDVDVDFTPAYDPWDQRLCFVPDGDLFRALRSGGASVVTDRIETFTESGIRLASGRELPADVVVTATGLELQLLGGMNLRVDGEPVDLASTVAYKGMMLSGVPNLALAIGYTNASWTLKIDLVTEYLCRLLAHMERRGFTTATPREPPGPQRSPLIDLKAGYVRRGLHLLPTQGVRAPWRLHQNYPLDVLLLRRGRVADEGIEFSTAPTAARARSAVPSAGAGR